MAGLTAPATVFDPFDQATIANPYPWYEAMRESEAAPFLAPFRSHLITRFDDCRAILRDAEGFSSVRMQPGVRVERAFGPGPNILGSDPPTHTRLRRLVSRDFTPRTIDALEPRIRKVVGQLLDERLRDGELDIMRDLAGPLPTIIIADLLGIPREDFEQFKTWSDQEIMFAGSATPPDEVERLAASSRELRAYLEHAIAESRAGRGREDGLISKLVVAAEDGDVLSEEELLSFVVLLLLAGNETTTNLIGNGSLAMARNPERQAELVRDPGRLPAAIEEFLRLDGPVQSTFRTVTGPRTVHGVELQAGDSVAVVVAAANRDPRVFEEPDTLRFDREENEHLAFGIGLHFCLGAPLARLEARVAFEALLERAPAFALAVPESKLTYASSFALRGLHHLPVRHARA